MFHLANRSVDTPGLSVHQKRLLIDAFESHKHNDTDIAERLYRQVLSSRPFCLEACNNLASILIEKDQAHKALSLLRRGHQHDPSNADIKANLAACHGHLEHWEECLHYSEEASNANPSNPMPWLWLARALNATAGMSPAVALLQEHVKDERIADSQTLYGELILYLAASNKYRQAHVVAIEGLTRFPESKAIMDSALSAIVSSQKTRSYTKILGQAINHGTVTPRCHYYFAKLLLHSGDEKTAITSLLEAVRQFPEQAGSWRELGLILRKQKNYTKATACLRRSIREQPRNKQAWSDLIDTLKEQEQIQAALTEADHARRIFPDDISLVLNAAYTHSENGAHGKALELIHTFFSRRPWLKRPKEAWNCEGLIQIKLQKTKQAVALFRKGLRVAPRDSGLWNNMGMAYGIQFNIKAETLSYRNAIRHAPDDHGSHMNLAMALLAQNDFKNGLREYEWRLRSELPLHAPVKGKPFQNQDQPKELLICTEQGLGDILQFSRFLYDLHHHYPTTSLTLACPEKLIELLSHSFPFVKNFTSTESFSSSQDDLAYIPIMSIPHTLGIHPHASCAPSPYITAPRLVLEEIKTRIQASVSKDCILIGLTWKGNPQTEKTNLSGRSMHLEQLRPLADMIPNALFISAQKGPGSEELASCSFRERFISLQDEISEEWSFVKNACYLSACDHVVTTDTCNAHLSGAIRARTHLLLSSLCEWRWRNESEKSRWYENTSVYKQRIAGDWRAPVEAVGNAILNTDVNHTSHNG